MKQILLIFTMVLSIAVVSAQTPHWDENTGRNVGPDIRPESNFSNIGMDVKDRIVTFSNVPEAWLEIKAIVTDADGTEVAQKSITPLNNSMNLHNLHKGRMYFVTLVYNNKTQKAYTLHL